VALAVQYSDGRLRALAAAAAAAAATSYGILSVNTSSRD